MCVYIDTHTHTHTHTYTPLEEEMATHSSILAWVIPQTEEVGYSPQNCKELKTTERPSMRAKEQEQGVLWVSLARCA